MFDFEYRPSPFLSALVIFFYFFYKNRSLIWIFRQFGIISLFLFDFQANQLFLETEVGT